MSKPKILFWDIETSYMQKQGFSLYPNFISPDNIMIDWHLICAAWRWEGQKRVSAVSLLDDKKRFEKNHHDDEFVIRKLHSVLEEADFVVAHNGDQFDIKKFNTRAIFHGLDPLPPFKTIDTLKMAKRTFKFSSNRLDYIAKFLGVGRKIKTSNELWIKCYLGDKKAIREMVTYNKMDVEVLQNVYDKLKPYDQGSQLNMGLFTGEVGCPSCTSKNFQSRGYTITRVSRYRRYQCKDCGKWFQSKGADKSVKVKVK